MKYSARLTGWAWKKCRCRASTFVISDSTENSPAPSTGVSAVGGDQAELVGRLDLVAPHQVRHRRVLGRHPEQAHALDQEARDQQPGQRCVSTTRCASGMQEQPEPDRVGDDHRAPPVEPVGERAGQRAEHDRRQQLHDQHAAESVVLRLVAVRRLVASAVVASSPSQSPRLDSAVEYQSRRNGVTLQDAADRGD